ncbi:chorismate mutase [Heyndrickxia shackletonii]|uniref:chorismate mutase n=1 Tax=Heyndrickxia shackletonii TaxID=157838 RepID=A0A0Q3WWF9_9BACI|nr:chorismate mutase [Heyndrickxia shackletonii]KQL53708.1 chorismate mutase [Heyndrickxia shackletonii]MBB2481663.1 chorismate mutase [Bacillus sp. APMAM]NEY99847.1 chorismate mutase [Heyndrickxia shackletonii]RTZ54955.1 chorismate mutase [Bacillus sp. SAJ1]
MIRGIRGATTVSNNQEEQVIDAADELLRKMIESNEVEATDVASVFISVTSDINAAFPSKALRRFPDWKFVPIMCMQEIPVVDSLPLCIRVMLHVNTTKSQASINHIYLKNAVILRPDLASNN